MKVAADSNAMLAQAKAGQQEITMFGYTGADLLPELERYAADGRHTVIVRPSTSTLIVGLNLDRPILSDVRVRRALLAGEGLGELWREALVLLLFAGVGLPLALAVFRWSVRRAKLTGTLAQY